MHHVSCLYLCVVWILSVDVCDARHGDRRPLIHKYVLCLNAVGHLAFHVEEKTRSDINKRKTRLWSSYFHISDMYLKIIFLKGFLKYICTDVYDASNTTGAALMKSKFGFSSVLTFVMTKYVKCCQWNPVFFRQTGGREADAVSRVEDESYLHPAAWRLCRACERARLNIAADK